MLFFTKLPFLEVALVISCLLTIPFPPIEFKLHEAETLSYSLRPPKHKARGRHMRAFRAHLLNARGVGGYKISAGRELSVKEGNQRYFLSSSQPELVYFLIQKGSLQQY